MGKASSQSAKVQGNALAGLTGAFDVAAGWRVVPFIEEASPAEVVGGVVRPRK